MIISLAVLIFYIFRKSESINLEERAKPDSPSLIRPKIGVPKPSKIGQFFLAILEKLIQKFKSSTFKIYNKTDKWFQSIKENKDNIIQPETKSLDMLRKISEPRKEIQFKGRSENIAEFKKEEEILPPRPTVREEMVQPETLAREKDEFEKLLIERIADNPKDIEAYERLGTYYIEIGNFSDSLECFEQVIKLSPTHRRARIQTRRLEKILGK